MILAIFAWLMQLSVFITPILQANPVLGFGVCEELAVVVDHQASAHSKHATHHIKPTHNSDHKMHMNVHDLENQKIPIHHADANCKFCLVFGHIFEPILLLCLIALFFILLAKPTPVFSRYSFNVHQKLRFFLFQNRAPPRAAVFTHSAVI